MKKKFLSILFALVLVLSFSLVTAVPAAAAKLTTIASSTMVFQSVEGYTLTYDSETGTYSGMIPMVQNEGAPGDEVAGFDLFARNGATAWFGDNPGTGEVWTPELIANHDAWPTWTPDTPDWYQYSLRFYEDGETQKWRVANHSGANADDDPWYDGGDGDAQLVEQGVPMSGTMDWGANYASETDVGEYLPPINPLTHPEIPGGAATKGGGPACWDMDWSWGSEVVPLAFPGFDVDITEAEGVYTVTLTPAAGDNPPGPVVNERTGESYGAIQPAIDDAELGDTISVAAGTYDPFTVDGKTNLTIQSSSVVTVQGVQSVTTAYGNRDCVVFVKDSTNIDLDALDIQGQDLGTINQKNYGVIYENSSGEIKDCTVSPNNIGNMFSFAIASWNSSEVTVDNCTIHNFGRIGVYFWNGCTASVLDSTIEGQVYSGEGEVCYGIEVHGVADDAEPATASQVTIRGNEIYNCDNTFYEAPTWQSGGVYINGWLEYYPEADSTVIVENNDIHNNYSGIIVIKSSLSYAHYNNIYDNRAFGVENLLAHDASTAVFDATYNWWGGVAGPQHSTNPYNTKASNQENDSVSNNVDFLPWMIHTELAEGWNIYSTPIAPDASSDTIDKALDLWGSSSGDKEIAYYYNGETQYWDEPAKLTPLQAVYIKMAAAATIDVVVSSEATFPPSTDMHVGWNLVGPAELGKRLVDIALLDAYWGTGVATNLQGYSKALSPPLYQSNWTYLRDEVDKTDKYFVPTEGYWVLMVNQGILGGVTTTPIYYNP